MEQVLNNETIEKMTSEIDAKLLEYENNHKSGTGKWYTIDDMNEMIDEENIYIARLIYSKRDFDNLRI